MFVPKHLFASTPQGILKTLIRLAPIVEKCGCVEPLSFCPPFFCQCISAFIGRVRILSGWKA
jgi:hypothetical protein